MTPSVGIVHDYLLVMRGAERCVAAMADEWPDAPIYTTVYSAAGTGQRFAGRTVRTSFLQRLPLGQASFRRALPLYPLAVRRLPTLEHDVLLSSSSAFAHGARARADAVHVCYCYTPFRYAWYERDLALAEAPRALRPVASGMLDAIQAWDRRAASRVTRYVAISELSRQRIHDAYAREADVVYPPVELDRFSPGPPGDYFLTVGELAGHKRIEVVLEACQRIGAPVKVVGTGPDLERLRARYADVAEFLGRVADDEVPALYRGARALVVPNVEEFGITAVEAQASGRPVVATDAGGVRETVVDGVTGVLVPGGGADGFAEALRETDFDRFETTAMVEQAQRFSVRRFQTELAAQVDAARRQRG